MKNADSLDCLYVARNIVYILQHPWMGSFKVHVKDATKYGNMQDALVVEDMAGAVLIVEAAWLKPVLRKQGTPAKPKKPHVKGSKPYLANCVPYDSSLIKVGTKVKCRDGKIRTINRVSECNGIHFSGHYISPVGLENGYANYVTKQWHDADIMKIILDKPVVPQQDKYHGYSVGQWHFWEGLTDVPPVDGSVMVKIWLRSYKQEHQSAGSVEAAGYIWEWNHGSEDDDIIAFKIIG